MKAEVEQLLILQDRDKKIRALERELAQAPAERTAFEKRISDIETRLDRAKTRVKEIEVERKRFELDVNTKREKINRFKTQQLETRKNEEYQALTNEIGRFEKDIEEVEDRELELMEEAESLKPTVQAAEAEAAATRKQVEQQRIDLEAKLKALQEQSDTLKSDRQKLTEGLDEDLLYRYDRIFQGKGEAVVGLEHQVCMGCHMKITTQTVVRVRGGQEVVGCDQCGRILFWVD